LSKSVWSPSYEEHPLGLAGRRCSSAVSWHVQGPWQDPFAGLGEVLCARRILVVASSSREQQPGGHLAPEEGGGRGDGWREQQQSRLAQEEHDGTQRLRWARVEQHQVQ
jgi:hypothetical protein